MPSAGENIRGAMRQWFGSIDLHGPSDFLLSHGFKIYDGVIVLPTPAHSISDDEDKCIEFLIDEWDYGFSIMRP